MYVKVRPATNISVDFLTGTLESTAGSTGEERTSVNSCGRGWSRKYNGWMQLKNTNPFKVGKTVKIVIFTAFVCCFELPNKGQSRIWTCETGSHLLRAQGHDRPPYMTADCGGTVAGVVLQGQSKFWTHLGGIDVSLDLQVPQKWLTYQNLQDLIRKTNSVLSIRSAQGISDLWQILHFYSPPVQLTLCLSVCLSVCKGLVYI